MKSMTALAGLFCAALLIAGCNDGGGGGGGSSSSGISLRGKWSGRYVSPSSSMSLSAEISQQGDSVIISTTKSGVGHLLTGTLTANGQLRLTDGYDGETWTSYGPVTRNNLRIRDYLYDPDLTSDSPEQDIYLSR